MSTREFEFKEGTSDKFWKISLEGKKTNVNFGRRGTSGQTQTKEWASADEARKSFDKQIVEKEKKGYVEITSARTTATAATTPRPPRAAAVTAEPAPAQEPAAKVAPEPSPQPVVLSATLERHIELTPEEWAMATWRKKATPAASAPTPAAFDRAACEAKLLRLRFTQYGWTPVWSDVDLPEVMSREEAHYWFLAMTSLSKDANPEDLVAELKKRKIDGHVTIGDARAAYQSESARFMGPEIVLPFKHLLTTDEFGELLLDAAIHGQRHRYNTALIFGFRQRVAPTLGAADIERLRARVRPKITPANWPSDLYTVPDAFLVAATLGMHDELRSVVESWRDDQYTKEDWNDHYHQPQLVILSLSDPALVEKHMRRMQLHLKKPWHVRAWLAHTEWRALDFVVDSILAVANKDESEELVLALHAVKAPEAAGPMLRLALQSKAPKAARTWIEGNAGHAIAGLAAIAGGRGALADAAVEQLRAFKRKGLGAPIAAAVAALPAEQRARVKAEVVDHDEVVLEPFDDKTTPAWLVAGALAASGKKAPAWVTPADLPPLSVDGRRLSDRQVSALFLALQASTLEKPHELVAGLRTHADPKSADAFAWKLFERWLGEGAPSKEKWAMAAIGALGGDASVLKLTPMVRAWPGESQHQRAVLGLEVLRAIGTDTALMQLNGIAQKLKFQGLKTKAREYMEAIAKDKGLTRSELEDRVVPDCDLDERGRRTFDFGPRRFQFVLGPEMKPMVRDDDDARKLRDNLPAPGAKDDAVKAEEATAAWKLMKKQIKEVARIQADRLEQAMVTGRRWKTADFETLILRHPLMTHLARLLLWGVFDARGLREAFRVTEDQDCANLDEEPYALPASGKIGLVHPLQLDDGAREAWGQRFADYAIISPFPQLGRPVHRLEKGEEKRTSLERFNIKLPAPTLVYTLEKLGWARGLAMDAGCFDEHSRQFPSATVTALLSYEGTVSMGYIQPDEELTITGCCFLNELREPSGYEKPKDSLELGAVDPIVLSETLHDLTILASKAKSA
jgi:predicted DNA-binding WGR domain protein